MKKSYQFLVLILTTLLTTGCTIVVKDEMLVSPSVEIVETNLSNLTNEAGYRPVQIASSGVDLYALERKRPDAEITILVLHGNALNLTRQPWYGLLEALSETEHNVLAIDYQGFGLSGGRASFSNMQKDAKAALAAIAPEQRVFLYGLSLGSVMAVELARENSVQGVILEGGLTTTEEMIAMFKSKRILGPLFTVVIDDELTFDNLSRLRQLDKPVLVIHGQQDKNIPFEQGESLFAAASHHTASEFYPVAEGGHCDTFFVDKASFLPRLRAFIFSARTVATLGES